MNKDRTGGKPIGEWTEKDIKKLQADAEKLLIDGFDPTVRTRWDVETGIKLIEEMAELTHAILKARDKGLFNYHPGRPEANNFIEMVSEIVDVEGYLKKLKNTLLFALELRHERLNELSQRREKAILKQREEPHE